jgi:hypothetical protein
MQSATNPLTEDEQFIVEANNELIGETVSEVFDEDPPAAVADSTITCVDATDSGQALLVLDELDGSGLNETVTIDRDELL